MASNGGGKSDKSHEEESNPSLGLARMTSRRTLEFGRDFWICARMAGSIYANLPIFAFPDGALPLDNSTHRPAASLEELPQVSSSGVFALRNVLTSAECASLLAASEDMGFTEDAPVSLGRSIRQNDSCTCLMDALTNDAVFRRCQALLPLGTGDVQALGLNRRWRIYKYSRQDTFRPHTDGGYTGSAHDEQGLLIQDAYRDRFSQLTWLLYLNDDFQGGDTRFFRPTSNEGEYVPCGEVRPLRGSVLCFFHGQHPLSPLHESTPVLRGTKYIIRSDVLYPLPSAPTAKI